MVRRLEGILLRFLRWVVLDRGSLLERYFSYRININTYMRRVHCCHKKDAASPSLPPRPFDVSAGSEGRATAISSRL